MAGRGNVKNLVNLADRDPTDAQRIRSMGAAASNRLQRERRSLREITKAILAADVPPDVAGERLRAALDAAGLSSMGAAVAMAQAIKAVDGDTEAAKYVRDTSGERPAAQVEAAISGPVQSLDMARLSDQELERLAREADSGGS